MKGRGQAINATGFIKRLPRKESNNPSIMSLNYTAPWLIYIFIHHLSFAPSTFAEVTQLSALSGPTCAIVTGTAERLIT